MLAGQAAGINTVASILSRSTGNEYAATCLSQDRPLPGERDRTGDNDLPGAGLSDLSRRLHQSTVQHMNPS